VPFAVYHPTIESTFQKVVRFRGEKIVLSIRDTAGQGGVRALIIALIPVCVGLSTRCCGRCRRRETSTVGYSQDHMDFFSCTGEIAVEILGVSRFPGCKLPMMIATPARCVSVSSRSSFQEIQYIHDQLLTSLLGTKDVARLLIGNKIDVGSEKCVCGVVCATYALPKPFSCECSRQVSTAEGEDLARRWGCPFMESSAKVGCGVCVVLRPVAHCMHGMERVCVG
jgi:hypothetical protein